MRSIIIIETSDVGAAYTAKAVQALGCLPIFICSLRNYQADTLEQITNYIWLESDTTSAKTIFATIQQHRNATNILGKSLRNVAGVISFLESRLSVAIQLAAVLGVSGIDPAVLVLADKGKVANLIPEYSPEFILFKRDVLPLAQLQNWLQKAQEIIIKPTYSTGALGLFKLDATEGSLTEDLLHNKMIIYSQDQWSILSGEWLAEPLIPGDLVSLEGYVCAGQVHFLGFSSRHKIKNTESLCEFPWDEQLDFSLCEQAKEAVQALIGRSHFNYGYFHVEFIFTQDRCALIDANMGRIGGGGIAQQIALAHHLSPEQVYAHVIATTLFRGQGIMENLYRERASTSVAAICYGIDQDAILDSVSLPLNHTFLHTLILGPGAAVPAMGKNNWSWVGIAVGSSATLPLEVQKISMLTDQGAKKPYFKQGE